MLGIVVGVLGIVVSYLTYRLGLRVGRRERRQDFAERLTTLARRTDRLSADDDDVVLREVMDEQEVLRHMAALRRWDEVTMLIEYVGFIDSGHDRRRRGRGPRAPINGLERNDWVPTDNIVKMWIRRPKRAANIARQQGLRLQVETGVSDSVANIRQWHVHGRR